MSWPGKLTCALLAGIVLSACAVSSARAAGACSEYLRVANINELFKDLTSQSNDPDDFVEVKLLDTTIASSVFTQWSLQVCERNGPGNNNDDDGCSGKISVGAFTDISPPWLILKDGNIGRYVNFKSGFDAILLDANDDVIDYLSVSGHLQLEESGCTGAALLYDYQSSTPGASDKFIFRTPDGTGDWDSAPSASADPTEDTSNDDDSSVPALTFTQPTIQQGVTVATITFTLAFAVSDTVTIDFFTYDGSLIAGSDYTATTTTRAFAAGQTSLTIDVPVSAASDPGQFNFFVSINNSTPGLASISSHVGRVTVEQPTIDNFLVDVGAGAANTCNPFEFTITARDENDNTMTGYDGTVSITTSSGNGNFSAVAATNPVIPDPDNDDNGSASYSFDTLDNGVVTLAISNEHAQTLTLTVSDTVEPATGVSTAVVFRDNAFTITDNDVQLAGDNVAVAGRDHAYRIRMIRKDPVTGCGVASGYAGNKPLKMWRSQSAADPSLVDPVLAGTDLSTAEPGASNGSILFTAGVADVFLETGDIGQYSIELADDTNTFAEITIRGTSTQQTVRPFGLAVTNIAAGATANPGLAGVGPDGDVFTVAGAVFEARVAGVLWAFADDSDNDGVLDAGVYADNAVTPGYAWQTELSADGSGYTPATGNAGTLANGSVGAGAFAGGFSDLADLRYSEVGSFTLQSSADDFLGASIADIVGDDIVVGRFTPAAFAVVVTDDGALEQACGIFTYVGQPFGYSTNPTLEVTAMNALPVPTPTGNYRDAYARLDDSGIGVTLGADSSNALLVDYLRDTMTVTPRNDDSGIVDVVFGADDFRYGPAAPLIGFAKFADAQIVPFTADIRPRVTTLDDGDASSTVNLDIMPTGNSQRFGRLRMANVHGSELNPLVMPAFTEYWDGTAYVENADDFCTAIIYNPPITMDLIVDDNLNSGSSTVSVDNEPANGGVIDYRFSAPGAGNDGYIEVTTDLLTSDDLWLRHDWDSDGDFDDDPVARATFGIFDGDPAQIYIRQIYP